MGDAETQDLPATVPCFLEINHQQQLMRLQQFCNSPSPDTVSRGQVNAKSVIRKYNRIFYDTSTVEIKVRETQNVRADICEAAQADVCLENCSSTDGWC